MSKSEVGAQDAGAVEEQAAVATTSAGAKLAGLPRPPKESGGSQAQQAFEALRDAGVIGKGLCRELVRAQTARTRIERSYVQTPAGDVHRAATLVQDAARGFISSYRAWIEPYLTQPDD
jgi:7-keto-8-aminopelargonate synthetase-like enzyme